VTQFGFSRPTTRLTLGRWLEGQAEPGGKVLAGLAKSVGELI